MLLSRRCVEPKSVFAGIARVAMIGAAACALAGCATDEEYRRAAYARDAARHQMAQQQLAPVPEVEDDGLPSQVAPPANRRREPDDPREPYSPNYGAASPAAGPVVPSRAAPASQPQRAAAYAPPSDAFQPRVNRIAGY